MSRQLPRTEEGRHEDPAKTLQAIRRGEIDAIVVSEPGGERLYELQPIDRPYQQLFEALPDSAVVLDDRGRVTFCTPAFGRAFGVAPASVERAFLRDLVI